MPFDPSILLLEIYSKKVIMNTYGDLFLKVSVHEQNWNQNPEYAIIGNMLDSDVSKQWNLMEFNIINDVEKYLNLLMICC